MKLLTGFVVGSMFLNIAVGANATLFGYVDNPTSNSTDWSTAITSLGGTINSEINFDTHSLGTLNSNFYPGVTLTPTGDVNSVRYGTGTNQTNQTKNPSPGEGAHVASNFLYDDAGISSLSISFDTAVLGVSLAVIDYFNPDDNNPLSIEAFEFGTGISLGSFNSVAFNFQRNNMYYMGLLSTEANIGSLTFNDLSTVTGDITGIDNIMYGTASPAPVPEPATMLLFGTGLAGLVGARFRRKK